MLGHIQQWFLGSLAGIRPQPMVPGFARFLIAPEPVGEVTWARGDYESIRGRIVSSWELAEECFRLRVTVPPNTTAIVLVPAGPAGEVMESGLAAGTAPGVKFQGVQNGRAAFEVGSGQYEFESR